ncbi:MAG: sodium:proton antiporter NhaD [Bacteroidaceae bacterium]|nr:sodium:proton antiporter NhaD [Bacteroidaceae bacterium]
MILTMIILFALGYMCIALEHRIKIDKSATALAMFAVIWSVYALASGDADTGSKLLEHLGSTCETLVFLIGAMTIVDLIDRNGGFSIITDHITSRNKITLLWTLAFITFFMSAVLDNMTTTIIMIMMLRKLVPTLRDRWIYAGVIIIAANTGGAWSPIGDVTTIMLWMRGNVTAGSLILYLMVPCLVSMVIPVVMAMRKLRRGTLMLPQVDAATPLPRGVGKRFSRGVLCLGVAGLLSVPVFKSLTGLPPYVGMMLSLGVVWIVTEWIYGHRKLNISEDSKHRVSQIVKNIDMPTILFFLGILMSVAGLQTAGILSDTANFLDRSIHEVFTITSIIGVLSSVIDNVPLVAACIGMYPMPDVAAIAASADPAYAQLFAPDGLFWLLLSYCAGVGGSILIIGSAAGVVAMGLERIDFAWYLKNISLMAFVGYMAGIVVILMESILFM